jgi:hypothetical protein
MLLVDTRGYMQIHEVSSRAGVRRGEPFVAIKLIKEDVAVVPLEATRDRQNLGPRLGILAPMAK